MSAAEQRPRDGVPPGVLIAIGLMLSFAVAATYYSRATGLGRVALENRAPYQVLQLRFEDSSNGAVQVRNAEGGDVIYVVEPGKGGFMRATLRTFAQARKREDIGGETPFRLIRWSDGTLSLDDPKTGRSVGLDAFGVDNAGAFAQLLKKREETK